MKTTTLNEIEAKTPCKTGWEILLKNLNKTQADDEVLTFKQILDSNGIEDAVWALRVLDFKEQALFRADVAESVLHIFEENYPEDKRPRLAIQAIRDYHAGIISKDDLNNAAVAAADAADAAYAAADAADAAADAAYAAAVYAADAAAAAADAAYAAYAAADAAYAAAVYAADAAAAAAAWKNIEELFIKHFC